MTYRDDRNRWDERVTAWIAQVAETESTSLGLSGLNLARLPDSVGELRDLEYLDLSHNRLPETPEVIRNLSSLTYLSLAVNRLTVVPSWLAELSHLTTLDLSDNQLSALPVSLGSLPLDSLRLDGNPLMSPPPEVVASGTKSVLTFLQALVDSDRQWVSKMLVVGEAAVGKTSVAKQLCALEYDRAEPQTHGVHVDRLDLDHPTQPDVRMSLNVWDFGGQLEYRATQRFYLTDRSLFLLVWNCRRGWRVGGQVEAWLQAITSVAPTSPIIVVGTHCNESVADLDENDLYRRYPRIEGILRVDNADGTGLDALREKITLTAAGLPLMGLRWPNSWSAAAANLDALCGPTVPLEMTDQAMAMASLEADELEVLRSVLHDRGEILHYAYDPELADTVILQPAWADQMITRLLDSQHLADSGGLLSRAHRSELWHDLNPGQRELLTILMERFDLAYRVDSPDHTDVALVVERLPAGAPAELPPSWTKALQEPGATELRTTYRLSSRQAGIPSWFIAREHRFTTGIAWSRGVLLTHRGHPDPAMALLEDDDQTQPTIRLTVRGHNPHTFYSILNEGFTSILAERYPGLMVRQFVPCNCAPGCDHEFQYATVLRAVEADQRLQCQNSFTMLDPRALLLGLSPSRNEVSLGRVEARLDAIAANGLTVLDTVRDLLRHRDEQGVRCPSIFTVTKTGHLGQCELQLFCEQPDGPHPLADGAGVYKLQSVPDWLRNYAPRLKILLMALKYTVPIVGPALAGVAGVTLPEVDKARIELSCKLLEDLESTAGRFRPVLPEQTSFPELRRALLAIDPDWGGLRERELPETKQIVYLCQHHRQALRYPSHQPDA